MISVCATLLLAAQLGLTTAQWPTCIEHGVDYTGLDLTSGYRLHTSVTERISSF